MPAESPSTLRVTYKATDAVISYRSSTDPDMIGWQTVYTDRPPSNGIRDAARMASTIGSSFSFEFYGHSFYLGGVSCGTEFVLTVDGQTMLPGKSDNDVIGHLKGLNLTHHSVNLTILSTGFDFVLERVTFDTGVTRGAEHAYLSTDPSWSFSPCLWELYPQPELAVVDLPAVQLTRAMGGSASFDFTGDTIYLYGSTGPRHGSFAVTLDGRTQILSGWSINVMPHRLLFFQSGLDSLINHRLNIVNLENATLDLAAAVVGSCLIPPVAQSDTSSDRHLPTSASLISLGTRDKSTECAATSDQMATTSLNTASQPRILFLNINNL
ncbi:hypothetical protein BKA62DRAFT_45004 [Auriculariales sp. MPI-PUGE-AT-0066]|nr:hypothetical protein BKA62DRAFT_45004 [Auriculariales sp. MPI-PUGE-AT-0066]